MSRLDPTIFPTTPQAKQAEAAADLRYRAAIQERRTSTGSAASSIVASDTPTVELNLSGSTLTGLIPTTAAPEIAGVGLAAAATSDAITVGPFSGQRSIVDQHGVEVNAFTGTTYSHPDAARWTLSQGTSAAPYTTEQPTVLINRTQNHNAPTYGQADFQWHAALVANNCTSATLANDETMVTGLVGTAHQFSNSVIRADACGLVGLGSMHGSTPGAAFGAYLEGRSSTASTICGVEFQTGSYESPAVDRSYGSASIATNKMQSMQLQTLNYNDATKLGGTGILFYRSSTVFAQFDVGIGVPASNTSIRNTTFRDDGAAAQSIFINGTHATAAIEVAQQAGQVSLGGPGGSWGPTRLFVKPASITDNAVVISPFSGSQSASLLVVTDQSASPKFSVNYLGHVGFGGAGGYAYLNFPTNTVSSAGIRFGDSATASDNVFMYQSGVGTVAMDGKFVVAMTAADQLLVGASSASTAKCVIKSGATGSQALRVMGISGQTVSTLMVTDSTGVEQWSIGSAGTMRAFNALLMQDTVNLAYIRFPAQTGTVPTPGTAGVLYKYGQAEGTTTATVRPSTSVMRSIDHLGVVRTIAQTLGDGSPVYQTPMQNTIAGTGTATTPALGDIQWTTLPPIAQPCVMNGIRFPIAVLPTGGAHKVIVMLHDANGVVVATSDLAGTDTAAGVAGEWFRVAFTAAKRISQPGTYRASLQFNTPVGTSTQFYRYANTAASVNQVEAGKQTGTFGTPATLTLPGTFPGGTGPLIGTY